MDAHGRFCAATDEHLTDAFDLADSLSDDLVRELINFRKRQASEVIARTMIGASDGLTLRYDGGCGRPIGNSLDAALIALCTSRAAPLISRPRSN